MNLLVCLFSSFFYDMWWKLSPLNCYFFSSRIFVLELHIIYQTFCQHLFFLLLYLCNYFKVFYTVFILKILESVCIYTYMHLDTYIFVIHTLIFHKSYHITNKFLRISVWVIRIFKYFNHSLRISYIHYLFWSYTFQLPLSNPFWIQPPHLFLLNFMNIVFLNTI